MVIGAFPVAKLGVLAIKQVSKPIANIIKERAKASPIFRNYICMPPAQMYNWLEVKTKMWALNLGKPASVPPLNEAMAIELGSNLLGEFIIFVIGAGVLVVEYARQVNKENNKREADKVFNDELTNTMAEMAFRLERQDAQIREMSRVLADIDSRSIFKWNKERLAEYTTFNPSEPDQTPGLHQKFDGVYNPDDGILFKALNFLESQIFINAAAMSSSIKHNKDFHTRIESTSAHLKETPEVISTNSLQ